MDLNKGMNVLSLFDGISCGRVALERLGAHINSYYASEIDEYAIAVTNFNYPDTIQLGDVKNWKEWNLPKIDLLMGGSPCQGFSFAGQGLNFKDKRSKLFFEFVDILNHYKPEYFLLENVRMKKEYEDVITKLLNVEPIIINSALVSAQNRVRLYWTNIKGIEQPEDKSLILKDVLEKDTGVVGRCTGRRINKYGKRADYDYSIKTKQYFEPREDLKSGCLTTVQKDNVLCKLVGHADLKTHDIRRRVYSEYGKSPTLTSASGGYHAQKLAISDIEWRYLTPLEYERLQTLEDNYTNVPHPTRKGKQIPKTARYNILGKAWTVDVIKHILSYIGE